MSEKSSKEDENKSPAPEGSGESGTGPKSGTGTTNHAQQKSCTAARGKKTGVKGLSIGWPPRNRNACSGENPARTSMGKIPDPLCEVRGRGPGLVSP